MTIIHKDCGFEIKDVSRSGTFAGYGSVYGVVDEGDDVVSPGAFTESLAAWAARARSPRCSGSIAAANRSAATRQ